MNNLYIIWEQCSSAFKKQGPDVLSGRGEGTAGGGGGGKKKTIRRGSTQKGYRL